MFEPLGKFEIYRQIIEIPDYMIDKIYDLKKEDLGMPKTNQGGWHSKTFTPYKDYYNGRYKWTKEFLETAINMVQAQWPQSQFSRAWFNLNPSGSTNKWHDHGEHTRVAVIYVSVPDHSGSIEFRKDQEIVSYEPRLGDFLVFPGKLEHRVVAGANTEDRISMAINF